MFTGIVAAVGQIVSVRELEPGNPESGVRLAIHVANFLRDTTRLGDSIAIQGACMTVVDMASNQFCVDVSRESLNRTVGLGAEGEVNLEHALRLGDSLDGHLVSGHVDGVGKVARFEPVGESWELCVQVPVSLARFMAYKGSVTVNGVSLTINRVTDNEAGCEISINLIPHTVKVTTLKHLCQGAGVNLEVDTLARYVDRMLAAQR